MILLLIFSFIAGVVTILSPCILPVLPFILSSGFDSSGKRRPLGVVSGFVVSFTFFTLFLSTIVRFSGIPADLLRNLSVLILLIFGLSLVIPKVQIYLEELFAKLSRYAPKSTGKTGYTGGFVVGMSLGLLWTPCVGPILASVISLAITGSVNVQAFLITLAYSLGTAIPMFIIMMLGNSAIQKVSWLSKNSQKIQRGFGLVMIATAVAIYFNFDRSFQSYILDKFPSYGVGLTSIEDNAAVREQLDDMSGSDFSNSATEKSSGILSPKGIVAAQLINGGQWFNTDPLTLGDLRGKVVIIDFWTYSCINCQRTLPYLTSWWDKYADSGLVIIGVHSPEFEFEKDPENVAEAIEDFGIKYPVMQDNNFATWRAYSNRYWPAKYFVDKDGFVRYTHFGEGKYDESEKVIQELLRETGQEISGDITNETYKVYSKTPETYLGYDRISNFASVEAIEKDKESDYSFPNSLGNNQVAFSGEMIVSSEYTHPSEGSQLSINFESKEVFLVMRSSRNTSKVRVFLDGKIDSSGADVTDGVVTIDSDSLYRLIKLDEPGRHELRLEFLDDNAQIYAFTFG